MMSIFDEHDLNGFIGKHLVYTYDNSWNYEIHVKNGHTLDYRIRSDIVGNHWVRDQEVYIMRVGESIYRVSWTEPTGTDVNLIINLGDKSFHDTIFLPRWIMNNPERTVCFQNNHTPLISSYHDAGPVYPTEVIDELATITFICDCGTDNDEVINCPASELPADFPADL